MITKTHLLIWLSRFVLTMIFFVGLNTLVWAWSSDPTVNTIISGGIGQNHAEPQIADDGAGGAIITWFDARNGNYDIFAQRVDTDGTVLWPANGVVICNSASIQWHPEIVSDGSGGAIIFWRDHRSGTSSDIFAQKIDANGVVQWLANGVPLTSGLYTDGLQIVADGAGGAFFTWADSRGGSQDIYSQKVNSLGIAQWTPNGIVVSAAINTQNFPQIIADGVGGAIIAWFDERDRYLDIYAQKVSTSGTVEWMADGVFISEAYTSAARVPQLISDGSGGAIFVWDYWASGQAWNIFMQRVEGGAGAIQWGVDGVTITALTSTNQEYPDIASDGDGGAYITWEDTRNYSSRGRDIYAQRVDAAGTPQWTSNGVVISSATNDQTTPHIIVDGGSTIITWEDSRSGNTDIYSQRVDINGNSQWTASGVAISRAVDSQYLFQIVADGSGGMISTWLDSRGANEDIYAQRVFSSGDLTPTFTVGGTVSGLLENNSVVLQNNGDDDLTVSADGSFTFADALDDGSLYMVTVLTQPSAPSQTCSVSDASGTLSGTNITNVNVTCVNNFHTVSTSAPPEQGAVTPETLTVTHNDTADFEINAKSGYSIYSVLGCGGTLTGSTTYVTAPVTDDCTVTALFNLIGDVDSDDMVDLSDVILALQVSVGMTPAATVDTKGDVDDDGFIGVTEAIYSLQKFSEQ